MRPFGRKFLPKNRLIGLLFRMRKALYMDTASTTRTRTFTWEDPTPTLQALRTMRGIDSLRAMVAGELPPPPVAFLLDMRLVEVEEGRVVFAGEPAEYQYNPLGSVHGGVTATLLDSALGCAVQSVLPQGTGYTTIELKV